MQRLSSFTVEESRVNNEIAHYVKNYFHEAKIRKTKAKKLLGLVSQSLKSIIAVVSLWVP